MTKALSVALAFPVLTSLAGCATDNRATQAQREALRSVSVNKAVVVPEDLWVVIPRTGAFGAMMTLAGGGKVAKGLKRFLARSGIDVGDIVRHEFTTRLTEARVFPAVVPEGGEGRIALTVERYGLVGNPALGSNDDTLRPLVVVTATLSNKDGQIVWKNTASSARSDDDVGAFRMAEYAADPELTRDAFVRAAHAASALVLQELGGIAPHVEASALASIALNKPSGKDSETSASGLLPAVGTTWTYTLLDHIYARSSTVFSIQVLQSTRAVVQESVTSDAPGDNGSVRVINVMQSRILEHRLGSNASLIEVAPYLLAAHGGEPPDALNVTGYAGRDDAWRIEVHRGGWQEIHTPAGTFRAIKYELKGNLSGWSETQFGAERFTIAVWYAPDVRRIIKLRHQAWTGYTAQQVGDQTVELIAYRPPPDRH